MIRRVVIDGAAGLNGELTNERQKAGIGRVTVDERVVLVEPRC